MSHYLPRRRIATFGLLAGLALAGCGRGSSDRGPSTASLQAQAAAAAAPASTSAAPPPPVATAPPVSARPPQPISPPAGPALPTLALGAQDRFVTASRPRDIAAADFDGDGRIDLATANDSGSISVLRGDGRGGFGLSLDLPAGRQPRFILAADLDGDSRPDLLSADVGTSVGNNPGPGGLTLALNAGSGRFQASRAIAAGDSPIFVAAGDLNGDGRPDLAVATSTENVVGVHLATAPGVFAPRQTYPVGQSPSMTDPRSVALGDLDGDGDLDIVAANYFTNNVTVLLNDGQGRFVRAVDLDVEQRPLAVTLADFDGDGRLDILTASYTTGRLTLLTGDVSGRGFAVRSEHPLQNSFPDRIAVRDFDRDGRPDLALTYQIPGAVQIRYNRASAAGVDFAPGPWAGLTNTAYGLAVADFDGDGRLDLATALKLEDKLVRIAGR